ncbi:hypothetical protein EMIT0P74_160077 [Pseudomonas sp. IT-P74]
MFNPIHCRSEPAREAFKSYVFPPLS